MYGRPHLQRERKMADAADALTESGIDEWVLHLSGWCDTYEPCSYCHKERKRPAPVVGANVPTEGETDD